MEGSHRDCRKFRKGELYTITPVDDEKYYYSDPDKVEENLYLTIEYHTMHKNYVLNDLS